MNMLLSIIHRETSNYVFTSGSVRGATSSYLAFGNPVVSLTVLMTGVVGVKLIGDHLTVVLYICQSATGVGNC